MMALLEGGKGKVAHSGFCLNVLAHNLELFQKMSRFKSLNAILSFWVGTMRSDAVHFRGDART